MYACLHSRSRDLPIVPTKCLMMATVTEDSENSDDDLIDLQDTIRGPMRVVPALDMPSDSPDEDDSDGIGANGNVDTDGGFLKTSSWRGYAIKKTGACTATCSHLLPPSLVSLWLCL